MRLVYHPHAKDELIKAAQYYEGRVPTLGIRFLIEVIERWQQFSNHRHVGG